MLNSKIILFYYKNASRKHPSKIYHLAKSSDLLATLKILRKDLRYHKTFRLYLPLLYRTHLIDELLKTIEPQYLPEEIYINYTGSLEADIELSSFTRFTLYLNDSPTQHLALFLNRKSHTYTVLSEFTRTTYINKLSVVGLSEKTHHSVANEIKKKSLRIHSH